MVPVEAQPGSPPRVKHLVSVEHNPDWHKRW